MSRTVLSVVVPIYNESANIRTFYDELLPVIREVSGDAYELIYVDDGSSDDSREQLLSLCAQNSRVKLVRLSRNFGKEIALAAGIRFASGDAVLMIDGDGQHPPQAIPKFIAAWRAGAQVVVGVRTANRSEGLVKKYGSRLFYALFNRTSGVTMMAGSSDFRLIDRAVQREFVRLNEPETITRGLIDWLGFERAYVHYAARPRRAGQAGYKFSRLVRLAANSFVSLSPVPLYAFGYLGLGITAGAFVLGAAVMIEQLLLGDPLGWKFTGTAMLSILVLFLVGLVLVAQGVMALYVSHIHTQSKGRPLFVVDYERSKGIGLGESKPA